MYNGFVGRRFGEPSGGRVLREEEERGLARREVSTCLCVIEEPGGPFLPDGCPSNVGVPTLGQVKKQPSLSEQVPETQGSWGKG